MLVENQKVKTTWVNTTREYYENLGYVFTGRGTELEVNAYELPRTSKVKVHVTCDDCNRPFYIPYFNYTKSMSKYNKYLCKECSVRRGIKIRQQNNKYQKYKVFLDWCNEQLYEPISTEDDCLHGREKLYYKCSKHGLHYTRYNAIISGQKVGGCCKNDYLANQHRKTIDQIQEIVAEKDASKLLNPNDYIDCNTKNLEFICKSCSNLYITSLLLYKLGTGVCPDCGQKIAQASRKSSITKDKYRRYCEKCDALNYTKTLSKSDFENIQTSDKISFNCPKHGYIEQSSTHFLNGESICYKCAIESRAEQARLNYNDVAAIIDSKNNNVLLNPEEYIKNDVRNLNVLCGSCKRPFITSLVIYNNNIDGKCPDCSEKSYGEYVISLILDKYDVKYTRQEVFDKTCCDKKPLPFDFYLPGYNLCIEYDGEGHYTPCFGKDHFMSTILHDAMKNWYCRWNNINLLRIPYWEFNNLESILVKQLNLNPMNKKNKSIKILSRKQANNKQKI